MSADRLREAAAVLRERAEAATPGSWEVCDFNDGVSRPLWGVANDAFHNPPSDDQAPWLAVEVHTGAEADAAYIAMMHPPVALALADWLDDTAGEVESYATWSEHALAVADEILGGDDA